MVMVIPIHIRRDDLVTAPAFIDIMHNLDPNAHATSSRSNPYAFLASSLMPSRPLYPFSLVSSVVSPPE